MEIKFGGSVDPIRVVGHRPGRIRRLRGLRVLRARARPGK